MRTKVDLVVLVLFLNLGSVLSQNSRAADSRPLPQWLTGIIAVVGFLFLTFVVFIVKRIWCEKPKRNALDSDSREHAQKNDYEMENGSLRRNTAEINTYYALNTNNHEEKVTAM